MSTWKITQHMPIADALSTPQSLTVSAPERRDLCEYADDCSFEGECEDVHDESHVVIEATRDDFAAFLDAHGELRAKFRDAPILQADEERLVQEAQRLVEPGAPAELNRERRETIETEVQHLAERIAAWRPVNADIERITAASAS